MVKSQSCNSRRNTVCMGFSSKICGGSTIAVIINSGPEWPANGLRGRSAQARMITRLGLYFNVNIHGGEDRRSFSFVPKEFLPLALLNNKKKSEYSDAVSLYILYLQPGPVSCRTWRPVSRAVR